MKYLHLLLLVLFPLFKVNAKDVEQSREMHLEQGFMEIPDSIQISVFWYWINDNISNEGIAKDLQMMKQVGINRAFIGFIGLPPNECPYGDIKFLSNKWWECLHTALKTATELDIEIGIFNCSGWSQSGGPWISTKESMRYLASSEVELKGPKKVKLLLQKPIGEFQDMKVLAFPISEEHSQNVLTLPSTTVSIFSQPLKMEQKGQLPTFNLRKGTTEVDVQMAQSKIIRSLMIYPEKYIDGYCDIYDMGQEQKYLVKRAELKKTNLNKNVGFAPAAPIVVSLPEMNTSHFQLVFNDIKDEAIINDMRITTTPILDMFPEKTLARMHPTPLPTWSSYLWNEPQQEFSLNSVIDKKKVIDISKYMNVKGILEWDVPAGNWLIMRMGMCPTFVTNGPASIEGIGLEVDKMSKEHAKKHFDSFLGEILRRIPAEDRKTWKTVVFDSYEVGGQNFTDDFLTDFKKRFGYNATPYLPIFSGYIVNSSDESNRFLWDVRRYVADKLSYDYMATLRHLSHAHGMKTWVENYGHWGFPGEFLQYGGQSDEVAGEFWNEGELGSIENRAAASCAHTYGKSKVYSESFTSAGLAYARHPNMLKKRADWSFTEGVNSTLLNVSIQQAKEELYPGIDAPFGTEFNRKNTWFPYIDLFIKYLKRCNYMLQQGNNIADVIYFIGDDSPKMTGIRDPELPGGYSYDYINSEIILNGLAVKNGEFVLPHGTKYKVLVLPKMETINLEVLQKIEQLVKEGGTIIGIPPHRSPSLRGYPESDNLIKKIGERMWYDKSKKKLSYGKGRIFSNVDFKTVFNEIGLLPDCSFSRDSLLYTHRSDNNVEIYFISNQASQKNKFIANFRVKNMFPELWDPITGVIRPLPIFKQDDGTISLPLVLDIHESAFVVFRKKGRGCNLQKESNYLRFKTEVIIDSPWVVSFESDKIRRGPTAPIVFKRLQDWSKHPNDSIRYYSGIATYSNNFELQIDKIDKCFYLDLGRLSAMAKIKINGKYAGGLWTPPYQIDITDYLKKGHNYLEIEIVNTWVNRLIGEQYLSIDKRLLNSWNSKWTKDSPLQESGLLGPVVIKSLICE